MATARGQTKDFVNADLLLVILRSALARREDPVNVKKIGRIRHEKEVIYE